MEMNQANTTNNQTNEETKAGNLSAFGFRPVLSKPTKKTAGGDAMFTIVKTLRNGNRIVFAAEIIQKIGSPKCVELAFTDNGIAVKGCESSRPESFRLNEIGKKQGIYCKDLVEEIAEVFKLDFSQRTSISFDEVTYLSDGSGKIASVVISGHDSVIDDNESDEDFPSAVSVVYEDSSPQH
ncbi:hypothetical protein [Paenibacillus whitsoniae]|uniref:Uncharacterized protein n=1 Tax=Paenibacillus whitsoniae TaxID=2496558 RepID=A0A3S0AK72_9BACL|nr:hypothetical protein [Paenibacillus whitsoniae]RTE02759.1 hypothetical protein EJQ19_29025 [Paenibacillus whitsoniae]